MDALLLSRLQFAFTIAWHIIFPAFSIGLASFLAVLEGLWLGSKREVFLTLYRFWLKIFAISFGMGVVSGVVMSYQFGANWSVFSRVASPVIGPLLAFEVLTAFFLEASFLGVMLFGWRKVGPRLHFAATVLVALGTVVSAFWIISANSWMQYPVGYGPGPNGELRALSWMQVIFSPTFPPRFFHMVIAAYLSTSLVVGAASAWALLKGRSVEESRVALRMAVLMFAVVAPIQLIVGDIQGKQVLTLQPTKLAAIEAYWASRTEQPFHLVAWPDRAQARNHFEISVPKIGSWITAGATSKRVTGLSDFPRDEWPPVAVVFWAFRIMVGLGLLMIGLGLWGAWLAWRTPGPESSRTYLRACVAMGPTGFIAVIAGWVVAEVGRQPWVIYGLMRTADAVSPVQPGPVSASLLGFLVIYAIVFAAGALYILRLFGEGPAPGADEREPPEPRAPGSPLAKTPNEPEAAT